MAKVVSLVMSFFIMAQSMNIDLVDIIQLDELIAHARFHSEKYEDNFFVFISKHYGELKQDHNQEHQEEQPEHEKLPFEHQSCAQHAPGVFVLIPKYQITWNPDIIDCNSANFHYLETYSLFEKQQVFQPPRFA